MRRARSQQRAGQRERQRKNGVLELDHFEHRAYAVRFHRQKQESNAECAVKPSRSGKNAGAAL